MPTASRKPRTNETPKRRASDRRRRGRAGGSPSVTAAARGRTGTASTPGSEVGDVSAGAVSVGSPGAGASAMVASAGAVPAVGVTSCAELGVTGGRSASRLGTSAASSGIAGGRLAVGCGGVGSPVGCGVGQVGHQMLMRGRPAPGLVPGSRDIFARARESVTRQSARPAGLGRATPLRRCAAGPPSHRLRRGAAGRLMTRHVRFRRCALVRCPSRAGIGRGRC